MAGELERDWLGKRWKEDVGYTLARACGSCVFFIPDKGDSFVGRCERVRGGIDMHAVCRLFRPHPSVARLFKERR